MKLNKALIAGLVTTLIASSCSLFYTKADKENSEISGIIPLQDDDEGTYANEARYYNWPNPDTMIIYIDNERYNVTSNGEVASSEGIRKLSIGNEYPLAQLFFSQRGRDLIVFYTDVDSNGAGSFVKRINVDSGDVIWTTEIDGFSFSKPLIRSQFAYVCTIGFIGKMKLNNGEFDWKYTSLGSEGRYNHFREIDFPDLHKVRFVAPHPFAIQSDTVIVSDITGEIIMMN